MKLSSLSEDVFTPTGMIWCNTGAGKAQITGLCACWLRACVFRDTRVDADDRGNTRLPIRITWRSLKKNPRLIKSEGLEVVGSQVSVFLNLSDSVV